MAAIVIGLQASSADAGGMVWAAVGGVVCIGSGMLSLALAVAAVCANVYGRVSYYFPSRVRARRQVAGLCPACGYDMMGNASGVCPECGTAITLGTR